MLDPNTVSFQETTEGDYLVLVGQLGALQAVTIDSRKMKIDPAAGPGSTAEAVIAEAKRALLVQLWHQIYGRVGGLVQMIEREAYAQGDMRYCLIAREAMALLAPKVQAPAPAGEEGEKAEGRDQKSDDEARVDAIEENGWDLACRHGFWNVLRTEGMMQTGIACAPSLRDAIDIAVRGGASTDF